MPDITISIANQADYDRFIDNVCAQYGWESGDKEVFAKSKLQTELITRDCGCQWDADKAAVARPADIGLTVA